LKKLHTNTTRLSVVFALLCTALFAASANAQDTCRYALKNTVEVGGNFSYGAGSINESRNTFLLNDLSSDFLTGSPYLGYFLLDKLEIGAYPFFVATPTNQSRSAYLQTMFLLSTSFNTEINANTFFFIEGLLGYTFLENGATLYVYQIKSNGSFDYDKTAVVNSFKGGYATGTRIGFKYDIGDKEILTLGMQYLYTQYNVMNSYTFFGNSYASYVIGFTFLL